MIFFFNDTATTEIYTHSLHDALPICRGSRSSSRPCARPSGGRTTRARGGAPCRRASASPREATPARARSEEHTSELQSRQYLVCRLLLEKKKKPINTW